MSAKTYDFTLPAEQARMVIAALAELPYKMAAPAIQNILAQSEQQDKDADAQAATESAQSPA